ncbi:MAG TPA: hypothetical protein DEP53_17830 [Bacteroidetes bacterium]|nr:hypothetical protein [Bacteroidota bacterium]
MLRLIRNDIRSNATYLLLVFMIMNLALVSSLSWYHYPHRYHSLQAGFGWAIIMVLIVYLRDAYYQGQLLNRSLPIPVPTIVLARYVTVILLTSMTILYGWLYQALLETFVPHLSRSYLAAQMESGYAVELSVIARVLGLCILFSVVTPLVFRYGTFWRIVVGFFAVEVVYGRFIDQLLALSLRATFFFGLSRWLFFASLIALASLAISARISVWLYDRRIS